jgi:hypothetical protein
MINDIQNINEMSSPSPPKNKKNKQYKMRDNLNLTTWMNKKNDQQWFSYLLHYFEILMGLEICAFFLSQSSFSRDSLNLTNVFPSKYFDSRHFIVGRRSNTCSNRCSRCIVFIIETPQLDEMGHLQEFSCQFIKKY